MKIGAIIDTVIVVAIVLSIICIMVYLILF